MKKTALLILVLAFGASIASAMTAKEQVSDWREFWSKEGKRSGIGDSTASWGNFWGNLNPVAYFKNQQDAYNARKAGK